METQNVHELAAELTGISMNFGGVVAVKDVDLTLRTGEVHGVVGKNGAGKSTLMKILTGVHTQTSGSIKLFGQEIARTTSVKEREEVVSMIFQEFSLIPDLTVVQNVFLNAEHKKGPLIDDARCRKEAAEFFSSLELDIGLDEMVRDLDTGQIQMLEISKALLRDKRILIMDEPTAALDSHQKELLFSLIRRLKESGVAVVFIAHHLEDVMHICDVISVIRDARLVLSEQVRSVTMEDIITAMLGEEEAISSRRGTRAVTASTPLVVVDDVVLPKRKDPISFTLHSGEVLGIAGIKGSGQTDVLNVLYGLARARTGRIELNGEATAFRHPREAIDSGVALVPGNRQTQGLFLSQTLYFNMLLPVLDRLRKLILVDDRRGKEIANEHIGRLEIIAESLEAPARSLSGGNQQKVVISKALAAEPSVMLLDDPTFGVDIRAKSEIATLIEEFAERGNGVIFVSSDLEELIGSCDRILVMRDGAITNEYEDVLAGGLTLGQLTATVHKAN